MFTGQLPRYIAPRKLASQEAVLEGVIPLASCPRVKEILADDQAVLQVSLRFEIDQQRRIMIRGQLDGSVAMTCQRCLDKAEIQLVACVELAVVRNEERARNLPASLDPLIVEDEAVELLPLLEQEILLNLPAFAYHENDTCHSGQEAYSTLPEGGAEELDAERDVQRPNPFSVLAGLKTGK